jgi:hypothetical protein
MDLRGARPGASRQPDAGEAEADKEKDDRDSKTPICASGNGCVVLGDAVVTAKLGKTGAAGRAEATAAGAARRGGGGGGMKGAVHWAVSPNRDAVANWSWAGNRVQDLARPVIGLGFHS